VLLGILNELAGHDAGRLDLSVSTQVLPGGESSMVRVTAVYNMRAAKKARKFFEEKFKYLFQLNGPDKFTLRYGVVTQASAGETTVFESRDETFEITIGFQIKDVKPIPTQLGCEGRIQTVYNHTDIDWYICADKARDLPKVHAEYKTG